MNRWLLAVLGIVACLSLVAANPIKPDPKWATVRGQVIWAEEKIPPVKMLTVRGIPGLPAEVPDNGLLIDAKSKGVKDAMVWLAPRQAGGPIPVAPALAAVRPVPVTITNSGAMYSPRIVLMQSKQALTIVNELPVPDAVRLSGRPTGNGSNSFLLPVDGRVYPKLVAERFPLLVDSPLHRWMGGRIGVFDHPYFALTDKDGTFEIKQAPIGRFRICVLHERAGWLHKKTGEKLGDGEDIEIKPGVNDLGVFRMKNDF